MHWVIQKSIFKLDNYRLLIEALERLGIEYTPVFIPNGEFKLEHDINPAGNVYVCGAIKLKRIAVAKNWFPGSFLNNNFSFDKWVSELGHELLNSDVSYGKFNEIKINDLERFFIRPLEDNKAFDGVVIDSAIMNYWRNDPNKKSLLNLDVIVSQVKEIYREYRVFVVKNKIVTGSIYKIAGKPEISSNVEQDVFDYVNKIIKQWVPVESFVIDVCLTDSGYKIIEFNNINSSGFYACDVQKYVGAIQIAYA